MADIVMNKLTVSQLSKKYYRSWIFKDLSFEVNPGDQLLLTGPNGSGKSTLIKIIAGQLSPTSGDIKLMIDDQEISHDQFYQHLSWAAPYIDLYPDLSLKEQVQMHFQFKKSLLSSTDEIIESLNLKEHEDKLLRHFSSGMYHRVRVGLAILSDSNLLLLDEATSNLDKENATFIFDLLNKHLGNRMLVFASNDESEFGRFEKRLELGAL